MKELPLTQAMLTKMRLLAGLPALSVIAERKGQASCSWVDGIRAIGSKVPVPENDSWHFGSLTKSMMATLVARLVESDLIDWSDSIGGVLGNVVPEIRGEYKSA